VTTDENRRNELGDVLISPLIATQGSIISRKGGNSNYEPSKHARLLGIIRQENGYISQVGHVVKYSHFLVVYTNS
jgi:hypothetical protein